MTKYDLLKLVVSKLRSEVQFEIADMIATYKRLDLINMSWRKIDNLVTGAWNIVSRRPTSYYSRLNLVDYVPDQAAGNPAVPFTSHAGIAEATAPCTNKTLKCQRFDDDGSVCNDGFTWTAEEQMLHKRLEYKSTPKSCPRHKQPPRQYANSKCRKNTSGAPSECDYADVERCKLFQAGKYGFGDQRKFAHADDQLAIAHPSTVSDDDEGPIVWHMLLEDEDLTDRHVHSIPNPNNDTDNAIYQLAAPTIKWYGKFCTTASLIGDCWKIILLVTG